MSESRVPLSAPPRAVFGTMERAGDDGGYTVSKSVSDAIKAGYRHFDTAELYSTTKAVGTSLAAAIASGLVRRHKLYITSKVRGMGMGMGTDMDMAASAESPSYDQLRARVEALISDLQVGYLDLLLLHWPGPDNVDMLQSPPENVEKACHWGFYEQHAETAWENMLRLKRDGLVQNVGVSNFYQRHLELLVGAFPNPLDRPFANQIYIDACHQEQEYVQHMRSAAVGVQYTMAYRPVAFSAVYNMLEDVAGGFAKTVAEVTAYENANASSATPTIISTHSVILAWMSSRGILPVCASTNTAHIEANLAASTLASTEGFDFDESLSTGLQGHEMVDMYGGCDEFAAVFKRLGAGTITDTAAASVAGVTSPSSVSASAPGNGNAA